MSLPFQLGFSRIYTKFAERGLHEQVVFIGAGKLGLPDNAIVAFALGCDMVNVAREAMLAIGCIQAQKCHTDTCPTGVATQNAWLTRGLDPQEVLNGRTASTPLHEVYGYQPEWGLAAPGDRDELIRLMTRTNPRVGPRRLRHRGRLSPACSGSWHRSDVAVGHPPEWATTRPNHQAFNRARRDDGGLGDFPRARHRSDGTCSVAFLITATNSTTLRHPARGCEDPANSGRVGAPRPRTCCWLTSRPPPSIPSPLRRCSMRFGSCTRTAVLIIPNPRCPPGAKPEPMVLSPEGPQGRWSADYLALGQPA